MPSSQFARVLLFVAIMQRAIARSTTNDSAIVLPQMVNSTTAIPLPPSYISYSIEFAFLPDFAGNTSHPNTFTTNLLASLTKLQGSPPVIRVGGNTQDKTVFHSTQTAAIISTYDDKVSLDYPSKISIGPAFFESYLNIGPNTRFIHGLNFALGGNCTACIENVVQHAVAACNAIGDRVLAWEYGNEPDTYALHEYRPTYWDEEAIYINWREGKQVLTTRLKQQCQHATADLHWIAPSFAIPFKFMDPVRTWHAGFSNESDISIFAQHNYVGVADTPGLTLRSSLLNHSHTTWSLSNIATVKKGIALDLPPASASDSESHPPFMLTETNSLARQGLPLVSDTFGAALWTLDYALRAASIGIQRLHLHQGLNYRYAAWQPRDTNRSVRATKPAFYGNAAVADFLGRASGEIQIQVAEINLTSGQTSEEEAAYVAAVGRVVERLAVVNLRLWNATTGGNRPEQMYRFVAAGGQRVARVKRLFAGGSDAYSGVTYGGFSYNVELDQGRPVRLENVTDVETVPIEDDGSFVVLVPDASAVVIRLV